MIIYFTETLNLKQKKISKYFRKTAAKPLLFYISPLTAAGNIINTPAAL